ncbi:hypothetical protein CN200_34750 [Sinorhizobium meliloti]|nr:hypothetical protein CN200_34750 [Sinorhizobium meliloti]RVN78367.1 hypothetical protein CN107_33220 [Sinorhizobium meliloti]RVN97567.1 hypothetical protein CN103_35015 [Sinorhizobium meliloti]
MSEHLLLAPLLESYFRRRLTKQRNATPATVASYRDALRMLILFAAARLRKKPAALALEDLDRDLVLAFLDELEEKRNNAVATRNARLAADTILLPPCRSRRPGVLRCRPTRADDSRKTGAHRGDAPPHQGRSGRPHCGPQSKDVPWSA